MHFSFILHKQKAGRCHNHILGCQLTAFKPQINAVNIHNCTVHVPGIDEHRTVRLPPICLAAAEHAREKLPELNVLPLKTRLSFVRVMR